MLRIPKLNFQHNFIWTKFFRQDMGIKFLSWNAQSPTSMVTIPTDSILQNNSNSEIQDPNRRLKILFHGYRDEVFTMCISRLTKYFCAVVTVPG